MVNLIVTLPTSYALSRSNFSGKKPITIFYLITMFFGGGLIPTYLVIQRLQMLNTIWALILPGMLKRIQHDRGKNLLQVEHFGRAV